MESSGLKQIEKVTLWDRAYAELRSALLAGRFAPGQRILLREVAGALGISLTPVRDAVNHLIAERVLERGTGGQGGGAIVPEIDPDHFRQLTLMRTELESRAAFEAAANVTPQAIASLRDALAQMTGHMQRERRDDYLEMHRRFHFGIYALADMPLLQDTIETLWLRCGPVLNVVLPEYVPYLKKTDYHAAALDALSRQDAQAVAEAIRRDIADAGEYIYQLLRNRQQGTVTV
ncbi:GntR family transcriptional regulator [Bordetella sp. 15P40C-2]|uniref:GntR family transcriptional regulator n=1 Tax=Bordetella sp. 15P40C-2 TaxID=2572246 RepID=UPI0013273177|nr:FCD domain-containing protein [Bordetella sp. 15P40C-2]